MTSVKKPQQANLLRETAYEVILSAIIFGDIPAGSSIDEKQIAESFDLGIASVRNALFRLSLEKIVERHARIGTLIPSLGLREIHEVFEARILLEGACVEMAAERASPAEIIQLEKSFADYKTAIMERDYRKLVRMDQLFHRTLAACARNTFLEQTLVVLHNNASRFWFIGLPKIPTKALISDIDAHFEVASAIRSRNPKAAGKAMRELLGHFPDYMSNMLATPGIYSSDTSTKQERTLPLARKRKSLRA